MKKPTVVLYNPQIPQNTGNIVRTLSVTGCSLKLVEPIGFSLSNRQLKRAGLDYWDEVEIDFIDCLQQFLDLQTRPFTFFSSKAETRYTDVAYKKDHLLIFGSEITGLPECYFKKYKKHFATIPMLPKKRCLNLATSCGIVLYEAMRQLHYPGLSSDFHP